MNASRKRFIIGITLIFVLYLFSEVTRKYAFIFSAISGSGTSLGPKCIPKTHVFLSYTLEFTVKSILIKKYKKGEATLQLS